MQGCAIKEEESFFEKLQEYNILIDTPVLVGPIPKYFQYFGIAVHFMLIGACQAHNT